MSGLTGYLILGLSFMLASVIPLMFLAEFFDVIAEAWRARRRQREPLRYFRGSGFSLGTDSVLRRRYRRRMRLKPLGRFGFDAKWVADE